VRPRRKPAEEVLPRFPNERGDLYGICTESTVQKQRKNKAGFRCAPKRAKQRRTKRDSGACRNGFGGLRGRGVLVAASGRAAERVSLPTAGARRASAASSGVRTRRGIATRWEPCFHLVVQWFPHCGCTPCASSRGSSVVSARRGSVALVVIVSRESSPRDQVDRRLPSVFLTGLPPVVRGARHKEQWRASGLSAWSCAGTDRTRPAFRGTTRCWRPPPAGTPRACAGIDRTRGLDRRHLRRSSSRWRPPYP
jgi:hypothetical protein